jgi:hypothetical protein
MFKNARFIRILGTLAVPASSLIAACTSETSAGTNASIQFIQVPLFELTSEENAKFIADLAAIDVNASGSIIRFNELIKSTSNVG